MNLIKQKAEIIENSDSKINNVANIARICYKSESKADDESNARLIKNLINHKHFAMLEHEDYIFYYPKNEYKTYCDMIIEIEKNFGVKLYLIMTVDHIISGNIRAWRNFYKYFSLLIKNGITYVKRFPVPNVFRENIFFDDILLNSYLFTFDDNIVEINRDDFIKNEKKRDVLAHYRVTAKMICDRGISHELVRHRGFSFAQESTRYVNYSKKGVQFIDYSKYVSDDTAFFETITGNNIYSSRRYNRLIENGNSPQIARAVLPHNLKTEIVMTGNIRAWLHFFNLRYFEKTGKAHPLIKDLAGQVYDEFENKTPLSKATIAEWTNELWETENE